MLPSRAVKIVPDIARGLPEIASGKRLLARVLSKRDVPEPVAAWRAVPEEQLRALSSADKVSYVEALLPLVRKGKTVGLQNLRRLYQLFTFMEIPAERRVELVSALFTKLRLEPDRSRTSATKMCAGRWFKRQWRLRESRRTRRRKTI